MASAGQPGPNTVRAWPLHENMAKHNNFSRTERMATAWREYGKGMAGAWPYYDKSMCQAVYDELWHGTWPVCGTRTPLCIHTCPHTTRTTPM